MFYFLKKGIYFKIYGFFPSFFLYQSFHPMYSIDFLRKSSYTHYYINKMYKMISYEKKENIYINGRDLKVL